MRNELKGVTRNEYRITVPGNYDNPNCPGHKDKSARQGHYYTGIDEIDAKANAFRDLSVIFPPGDQADQVDL